MTTQILNDFSARYLIVGFDAVFLVCVEWTRRSRLKRLTSQNKKLGRGNDRDMESRENGVAVSHPSHSPLEDARSTGVSHIPTANGDEVVLLET